MKKKWGAYIYVPVLACLVAGGGAYIWKLDHGRAENTPNQVYYLDEYFEAEADHTSEAHVVDEKDVILEKSPADTVESVLDSGENPEENIVTESGESQTSGPMKNGMISGTQAEFILQLENGHVTVYRCEDMSESYISTGIHVEDLPEETLKEIIDGKEILDEESLYFFLESYSS